MTYRIPLETEIIPFNSKQKITGIARQSTIRVDFEENEILDRVILKDESGKEITYYQLSLGENPTSFDSYLVEIKHVQSL